MTGWKILRLPQHFISDINVCASSSRRMSGGRSRIFRGIIRIQFGNLGRKVGIVCCSEGIGEVGSSEWMARANPLEVLGVHDNCTEEEIKAAFRAKVKEYHPDVYKGPGNASAIIQHVIQAYEVKEYHPDVYKGPGNASAIIQHVIQAYEILCRRICQGEYIPRKSTDPFEEPDCEALDIFVNELLCIGKGCPYSCVIRAPHAFAYASDTNCARAVAQGQGGDYHVQLAVGQCPRNCIHYVTPAQRVILEELLARALEGTCYVTEVAMLESLISRASFENNRYQGPKRNAKHSTQWVDWF